MDENVATGSSLFHMTFLFWVILDSPGNIPLFVSLLKPFDPPRQRKIIWRELIISLIVMLLAFFFGTAFFKVLGINTYALMIAGGIILFILAVRMIFPPPVPENGKKQPPKEPLIVPLAVPAVAGPGIIATIALYSSQIGGNKLIVFFAILLSWAASVPVLLFSSWLKQLLGQNGLIATERLLGYLVVLISSDMALNGLRLALKQ
ncbi:MAG TPA: MarC family protein [Myxococcota bacterium]|nr:MarC family protein [Myxococcota bacterium]